MNQRSGGERYGSDLSYLIICLIINDAVML